MVYDNYLQLKLIGFINQLIVIESYGDVFWVPLDSYVGGHNFNKYGLWYLYL